jgi:hypothetical protein
MKAADFRFIEYLDAKRSVDDRSLHPRVWARFLREAEELRSRGSLEIAELGAGIGTMALRVFRALGAEGLVYHLVDENPGLLEEAARRIPASSSPDSGTPPDFVRDSVLLHTGDAAAWLDGLPEGRTFQAVLANAFLDLVDIPAVLDRVFSRLMPGGLGYFTINYDGRTDFLPALDGDGEILAAYNGSMRERKGSYFGTDASGRRILGYLLDRGYPVLDAGASDWVLAPRPDGDGRPGYTRDEETFLGAILGMVEDSVSPSIRDPGRLSEWLEIRKTQVRDRSLIYVAHQLDILARKPA